MSYTKIKFPVFHEPHIGNTQPVVPILVLMNPDHTLILYFCKKNFNIIHSSTPKDLN
jgi:hypothetical protein